jgi:hypothetical protein
LSSSGQGQEVCSLYLEFWRKEMPWKSIALLALPLKVTGKNRAKMLGKFLGKAKTQNVIGISS